MNSCLRRFPIRSMRNQAMRKFSSGPGEQPKWMSKVPLIGVVVGLCAFSFQVGVLFPWHHELSVQFEQLQDVVVKVEKITASLDERMNTVVRLEEEVKAKERRILDKEEEILMVELKIAEQLNLLIQKQGVKP